MLTNMPRLRRILSEERLDAVVGACAENVTYLSGFWAMSQWVRRGPQCYVLHTREEGPGALITNSGLLDLVADQELWIDDIRRYGFFQIDVDASAKLDAADRLQQQLFASQAYKGAIEALVAAIRDRGLTTARIGIDEQGFTPQAFDELEEALPEATFVRSFSLIEKVRAIKTPDEIARLTEACRISGLSIDAAIAAAREGITEREMLRVFAGCTVANDASPVTNCIGFGNRSAMINVQPSDRALRRGDVIRFDVGCRYRHYRSDIARIAYFGTPPEKLVKYHRAVEKGVQRAYDIVKPGLPVATLFEEVVATVQREGIPHYARSHVGHGIGVDGYDPPNIAASTKGVLEENMVICVETPYYELGFAGLQSEDMMRVTATGVESLTQISSALRIVD